MCLDVWSKIIKVSYDEKILKANNLLMDADAIDENQKYCGFISNVNANGVVIEFCNNLKGIISQREL
jgi:ribosomal protein S1